MEGKKASLFDPILIFGPLAATDIRFLITDSDVMGIGFNQI